MPKTCQVAEQLEREMGEAMNRKMGNGPKRYSRAALKKVERDSALDNDEYLQRTRKTLRLHQQICGICRGI
jgi:hypothetical protein